MKLLEFVKSYGEQGITQNELVYNKNVKVDELMDVVENGKIFRMPNGNYVHPMYAPIYHKTKDSAGADVAATKGVTIKPGEMKCIETALTIPHSIEPDETVIISPRSSTWNKVGTLILVNSIGIIDADFPDTVGFQYVNIGSAPVKIAKGQLIGQAMCVKTRQLWPVAMVERTGGIGSTDNE